jgi:hypothetical protein
MSKRIAAIVMMLMTGLPAMAAPDGRSVAASKAMEHQFHLQPRKGRSKFADRLQAEMAKMNAERGTVTTPAATARQASGKALAKPRRNGTPPVSTIGFVSAAQIAAGGNVSTNQALEGDFNGDGKPDLLTLVVNQSGGVSQISAAVALGNGDGTFQPPVLTAIPSNNADAFVVANLSGSTTDLVIVHQPGSLGTGTPASFDVMMSNGDGTFAAPVNYVVTANDLAGGIMYDVNGDGVLDAVIVDSATPGNVWTLLGNGDGTFQPPTSVALSGPVGANVVFADFKGDGLLDIADNDGTTGELTVFLATSTTTYAPGVLVSTADGNYDAVANAVGDMTGDGKPEIVSVNLTNSTITVYLNNGDGTFQTGTYFDVATAPNTGSVPFTGSTAVSVADVNGDGKADVVVTNDFTGDMTVLLSNGDGTVQTPSVGYATGGYPLTAAVVMDFNGDGLPDIVVTDEVYSFSYMKGYGDGTFRAATDFYTPTTDSSQTSPPDGWDIATGDFNGDGIPDVVIGNWCCDATVGVTVFLSRGDGSLQPGVNYGSGGSLAFVAVGDFNQDGNLDIAAVDPVNEVVQIFLGKGDGTFTAGASIPTGDTNSQTVVAADLNGDGYPDLVVANQAGSDFAVIMNDGLGDGAFLAPVDYPVSSAATVVAAADVNGDGVMDLVLPGPSCGCVAVFLGNPGSSGKGDGTFGPENDFPIGTGPSHVVIGDVNGDGIPDLAVTIDDTTAGGVMGVAVALGNGTGGIGNGTFQAPLGPFPTSLQTTTFYEPYPDYVKMTDLNGDGIPDLVVTNRQYGTVGLLYGVGNGTFDTPVEYPAAGSTLGLALADVVGDGTVDAITVGTGAKASSEATVLLNTSSSAALPNYSITTNPGSATVTAGSTGTYTITLTPKNFYNGTVTFACGTLPSETTCNFSSPTLTPNGNPPMTTTLTLVTTAASSAKLMAPMNTHRGTSVLVASLSGLGLFGLMLVGDWRKKSGRRMGILVGVMVLGTLFATVGCGGGSSGGQIVTPPSNPGTPTGTYTVVVTATGTAGSNSGNTSPHTVNVTLTVQQ